MVKRERITIALLSAVSLVIFFVIVFTSDLTNMLADPKISSYEFLINQPHEQITLLGKNVMFTQPSSSGMVYFLGILTTLIGAVFLVKNNKQTSRKLWGISLIFWGIAAVSAGLSYQSFGYELKAKGNEFVLFTSMPEIIYMLLQSYSTAFMVSAIGYFTLKETKQRVALNIYSAVVPVFYSIIMLIGINLNNTFLISYTGFIIFCGYNYLVMAILSIVYYFKNKDKLNKYMIILWVSFLLVNVGYFIHLFSSNSVDVWHETGVWFTENDTLHVLLIVWMLQIAVMLYKPLRDLNISEKP